MELSSTSKRPLHAMASSSLNARLLIPMFLLFFWQSSNPSSAIDSISLSQSLSGDQTIISSEGNFALGFFAPAGNPSNFYAGIWYNNLSGNRTVVWVANRACPISNTSAAEFKISEAGNLVIVNSSGAAVWSSNSTPSTLNASVAVLLGTGNLVLKDDLNSSTILWQSFDHPTDTWMPGGWLGVNKRTGEYQSITSWASPVDPAPGPFAQSMDPDGSDQYVLLWNGSEIYWNSGLWNGQYFTAVPGTKESTAFNFTFVDNPDRKFAMYTINDPSFLTRFVVDSAGQGQQWFWLNATQEWQTVFTQPLVHCDVYSLCGPFGICSQRNTSVCSCPIGFAPTSTQEWQINDWNSGCTRRTRLHCGNKSSDGFLVMPNVRLPANSVRILTATSSTNCKAACLNNCSCSAYSYDNGCSIWGDDLRNIADTGGGILYIRLAASDLPATSNSSHKSTIGIILGVAFGVLLVLVVLFALIWIPRRRKRTHITEQVDDSSLVQFSYGELQRVTRNFSRKLGGGGFGNVYRGTLPDSTEVAVKKLEGQRQGEKQFRAEVSTLGTIQHVNLVRLRGFCCHRDERLLVYDYMPGGSLDSHFSESNIAVLDWKLRYRIILGVARGLAYLHGSCRECIIHCDVKPENILLDENFDPKIADFGMAKLIGRDFSRVLTTMRGTVGYLAPEWISGLPVTPKVDVYSFGMMLFELVAGKRNSIVRGNDGVDKFYPSWAAKQVIDGSVESLLDDRLEDAPEIEELTRVCRVACWCIQDSESQRPTMGQVVRILEGSLEVSRPPLPLAMQSLMEVAGQVKFQISSTDSSATVATNTYEESSTIHGR
ncbi:hypothetical protein Cni_G17564 [Canna indica]|uniref:Receptor-like serine/threonine-protein kinase n=1 Tax=Canna indica TaxID=4628 RepID=A0AAQ3QDN6_9LILI|nr:hypothetical protein Cni_G17564 [Canna indica]